jgi:tetratricopeptide (TPR) repeat protein
MHQQHCPFCHLEEPRRQFARALERFRQAVEMDPSFADAWNNLGITLAELGHKDDALDAFHRALEENPKHGSAHYNLADLLDEIGRNKAAAAHWRAYLGCETTGAWARHTRHRLGEPTCVDVLS